MLRARETTHLKITCLPLLSRLPTSHTNDSVPLVLRRVEGPIQSKPLPSRVRRDASVGVCFRDELLAARVDEQANQVRAHVVAAGKIAECLREVAFIKIDLHERIEVISWASGEVG